MKNEGGVGRMVVEKYRDSISYVLSAILGLTSVIIPALVIPGIAPATHPLYPSVLTGIGILLGGHSWLALMLLGTSGVVLGALNPRKPWRWGVGMMTPFPALAVLDMVTSMANHQIWPLEFLFYALLTVPGIIGGTIGGYLRNRLGKDRHGIFRLSP